MSKTLERRNSSKSFSHTPSNTIDLTDKDAPSYIEIESDEEDDYKKVTGLISQNKFEEAIKLLTGTLDSRIKRLGSDHLEVGQCHYTLGNVYLQCQNFEEAISQLKKAIPILKKKLGKKDINLFNAYFDLAKAYLACSATEDLHYILQKAQKVGKKAVGEDNPKMAEVHYMLGQAYLASKDYEESEKSLEKALRLFIKNYGINDFKVAETYELLGSVYSIREKCPASINAFKKALRIYTDRIDKFDSRMAKIHYKLAVSYIDTEAYFSAIKSLESTLAILENQYPGIHKRKAEIYRLLGSCYFHKGDYSEMKAMCNIAIDMYKQLEGNYARHISLIYFDMGAAATNQNNFKEALYHYLEGIKLCQSVKASAHDLENLCNFLTLSSAIFEDHYNWENALAYTKKYIMIKRKLLKASQRNTQPSITTLSELEQLEVLRGNNIIQDVY